jgi:hypothetical protein
MSQNENIFLSGLVPFLFFIKKSRLSDVKGGIFLILCALLTKPYAAIFVCKSAKMACKSVFVCVK